jgi:hypothetical protein
VGGQKSALDRGGKDALVMPSEHVYQLNDPIVAAKLGLVPSAIT